jgi:hypothetical protein
MPANNSGSICDGPSSSEGSAPASSKPLLTLLPSLVLPSLVLPSLLLPLS